MLRLWLGLRALWAEGPWSISLPKRQSVSVGSPPPLPGGTEAALFHSRFLHFRFLLGRWGAARAAPQGLNPSLPRAKAQRHRQRTLRPKGRCPPKGGLSRRQPQGNFSLRPRGLSGEGPSLPLSPRVYFSFPFPEGDLRCAENQRLGFPQSLIIPHST